MWIWPKIDLFASNPLIKRYIGRPSWNILELCNIDFCLNKDLHKAVYCHVSYTHSLHKLYLEKFSIAMSKKGTPDYLRIFDIIDSAATSSKQIISDMYDVLISIKYIMEAEGCIINDVNNVNNTCKGRQRES